MLLASCGGGGSSSSGTTTTSGIKKRAFVTNATLSQIEIVNAANDTVNTTFATDITGNTTSVLSNTISAGSGASLMALSQDKKITMVFDRGSNMIAVIDNTKESGTGQVALPDFTESMAVAPNDQGGYAAVRNAPVSGQPSGGVLFLDLVNFAVTSTVPVPAARRIVLSNNGTKLLVFSDNSDSVVVIDVASKTITTVLGFDRPVWGVFNNDDSIAYILSCGPECGGVAAGVTALKMSDLTHGAATPVSAATTALLDGNNLYVAGTQFAAGSCGQPVCKIGGRLDVVNIGSMTVSKSGVPISDGFHMPIALADDSRLYIGATTCSNTTQGCLSIYNTGTQTAVASAPKGDVTGLQPITGRHVVYVIEGAELRIYSTLTDAPQATQIDVVGTAVDVKLVD